MQKESSNVRKIIGTDPLILREVLAGLTHRPKRLPSKLLYDKKGSELFERICLLEEYYPWRTEVEIIKENAYEIAEVIGPNAVIIEPGSGAGIKIREIISMLQAPIAYIPIEISVEILERMSGELKTQFPNIEIHPVEGDFLEINSRSIRKGDEKRVIFFPGSTLGNFDPDDAIKLLRKFKSIVGIEGAVLVGFDLKKNPQIIEKAYNDELGVTAEFNLNLLERINRETDANFKLESFSHHAFYNEQWSRVEMHLVSNLFQQVRVHESIFIFKKGESIHTENSYKYSLDDFKNIARKAKMDVLRFWTDKEEKFCIAYLTDRVQ